MLTAFFLGGVGVSGGRAMFHRGNNSLGQLFRGNYPCVIFFWDNCPKTKIRY